MHSDIHKLILQLAKRMLEQEKHILPVDELFDDDVIGDYVKSIQIDSPYQQMLLEGVLTYTHSEPIVGNGPRTHYYLNFCKIKISDKSH